MTRDGTTKIPIERVNAPGEAWLELRGSILVYHKRTWVASSSMFIPVERVGVSHGRQYDLRRLWLGILGVLVAILLAMPLSLILFRMPHPEPADLAIAVLLAILLAVAVVPGLWSLFRFFFQRPTTTLSIDILPYASTIRFWRGPRRDPALDALLERLAVERERMQSAGLDPVRMSHSAGLGGVMWRRPLALRVALIKGLVISFLFYLGFLGLEILRFAGHGPEFSRWYYAVLAVPPLFHLGSVTLRKGATQLREPKAFRHALRCHARGDLAAAARRLDALFEAYPDHALGRLLMVRVCTEQGAFDDALRHCEALVRDHPATAMRMQNTIWSVRRMHERMDGA